VTGIRRTLVCTDKLLQQYETSASSASPDDFSKGGGAQNHEDKIIGVESIGA
jgi:hypothetical protein